jgi:hypothetical protein
MANTTKANNARLILQIYAKSNPSDCASKGEQKNQSVLPLRGGQELCNVLNPVVIKLRLLSLASDGAHQ